MPPPTKDTVLDLEVRRRILDAVREHPGLHLRALAEMLALPLSTLEYHCYQLVRHGHLTARQDGGFKAFYPSEGLDRRDKDVLYVVRHEAPRRICTHLVLHPGATPKSLKEVTGLAGPTLSFHLKRLREAGVLREEPEGRTKRLFLVDAERIASVLVTYRRSFLDDAVDRFAQAWLAFSRPPAPEPGADREEAQGASGADADAAVPTNGDAASEADGDAALEPGGDVGPEAARQAAGRAQIAERPTPTGPEAKRGGADAQPAPRATTEAPTGRAAAGRAEAGRPAARRPRS